MRPLRQLVADSETKAGSLKRRMVKVNEDSAMIRLPCSCASAAWWCEAMPGSPNQ